MVPSWRHDRHKNRVFPHSLEDYLTKLQGLTSWRHAAKNIVAAGLADKCELELAYVIGVEDPVSVTVETYGTGKISDDKLVALVIKHFDLTPAGIIDRLKLRRPIYKRTAAYGHFGREEEGFTWELTDYADILRDEVK